MLKEGLTINYQQILIHVAIIFGMLLFVPIICILLLSQSGGKLQTAVMDLIPGYGGRLILLPGVVIHELSHLIAAKLFLIRVTEVKLFIFDPSSLTLGYVKSAYNPNSLWQRLGETATGIAPLFGITGALSGIYALMFHPSLQVKLDHSQPVLQQLQILGRALGESVISSLNSAKGLMFIAIMIILLTGFALSSADLQTSLVGLGPLIGLLLLLALASIQFPIILRAAMIISVVAVVVTGVLLGLTVIGTILIRCIQLIV